MLTARGMMTGDGDVDSPRIPRQLAPDLKSTTTGGGSRAGDELRSDAMSLASHLWTACRIRSAHRALKSTFWGRWMSTNADRVATPYSILFFGSDAFSVACLRALLDDRSRSTQESGHASVIGHVEVVVPFAGAIGKGEPDALGPAGKASSLGRAFEAPLHQLGSKQGLVCHEAPPKSLIGWQVG